MRLVVLQSDGRPGDTETEGETDMQRERRKETEHDTEMDRDGQRWRVCVREFARCM
jgi:hypothetical protein